MLYRVLVDGDDILDYTDPTMILLSPQAEIEIDVSGSFEFTIPPNHIYYDRFVPESIMKMLIEIYEDNILHWFGRPIELHLDFYKNKKIYCEGALGFFNDSVIREAEYEETLLSTIFAAVIAEHNTMVDANRRFTVGQFTVPDHAVYRKFNYEQTSDVLKSKFLDAEEGHFFVRRENGVNYIDFLKDMPYTCDQPVQFAKNLLNFTYSFDGKDFATCVIPLGANDAETNKPITIAPVNNNSDILVGNAASNYGNIVKVQHYSDLVDPSELLSEGRKYLTNLQYNAFLIECSAVDLHAMTPEVEDVVIEEGETEPDQMFRVGQKVICISNPHGINLELPISKMTLYLDSAAKQITLGRIPKKTLSRFYKDNTGSAASSAAEMEPEVPAGWEIVPPDTDGGEPTLKRVPVTIQITHLPLQTNYTDSDNDFDPTGIEVKLVAQGLPDLQYFTDEWYPYSIVPTSELSYEIGGMGIPTQAFPAGSTVPNRARSMVWVIWTCSQTGCPYYGKSFRKAFYINQTDAAGREASEHGGLYPDHIAVVSTGLDYAVHKDGQYINTSGLRVKAYYPDGSEYDANGYAGGLIPNTELRISPNKASISEAIGLYTSSGCEVGGHTVTGNIVGQSISSVEWGESWEWHQIRSTCPAIFTIYNGTLIGASKTNGSPIYWFNSAGGGYGPGTYQAMFGAGWIAYYGTIGGGFGDGTPVPKSEAVYEENGNPVSAAAIAWILLYDAKVENGMQPITVQWTAPNGEVLETSFTIKVKVGSGGNR